MDSAVRQGRHRISDAMTIKRVCCDVPGCRNSSAKWATSDHYLCSRHWRMVPKRLRAHRSRMARLLVKAGEIRDDGKTWWVETDRARRIMSRCWKRISLAAIEAAAGL